MNKARFGTKSPIRGVSVNPGTFDPDTKHLSTTSMASRESALMPAFPPAKDRNSVASSVAAPAGPARDEQIKKNIGLYTQEDAVRKMRAEGMPMPMSPEESKARNDLEDIERRAARRAENERDLGGELRKRTRRIKVLSALIVLLLVLLVIITVLFFAL